MSYQPRIPTKFTTYDGSSSVFTFPLADYEWGSDQPVNAPTTPLTGANYEYDTLGDLPSPKKNATEHLRFTFRSTDPASVDTDVDAALAGIRAIRRGWLYTQDANGVDRRAYARAVMLPSFSWQAGMIFKKGANVDFARSSDWYSVDEEYPDPISIDSDDFTVTITNPGTERVYNSVITVKGPFAAPSITNDTNAYGVQSSRSAGDDSGQVRLDAGVNAVLYSTDTGGTFANDYANASLTGDQVQIMILEPGDNTIHVTGANGGTLVVTFFAAFS